MTPEEVAHAKEVRDAEKYAEMKAAFDRQLREASTKKTGKNVKILDQNKYVEKIKRLEDLRTGQVKSYLIIVIFFTLTKLLENKIYT